MSNWTAISEDDLKAAGHVLIISQARAQAGEDPVTDPIEEAVANVVAEVRNAVRAGNRVDTDETKIPRSLKRLAMQIIIYALMEYIGLALTDDQKKEADRAQAQLRKLFERKVQVEPADDPDTAGGPVNPGMWNSENKIIGRTHPVPAPGRQFPPLPGHYANPDAPTDSVE